MFRSTECKANMIAYFWFTKSIKFISNEITKIYIKTTKKNQQNYIYAYIFKIL